MSLYDEVLKSETKQKRYLNTKGGNGKWNTLKKQLKILERIGLEIM